MCELISISKQNNNNKKCRRGINGQTFSQNPRKRGKSHHHHHQNRILVLDACSEQNIFVRECVCVCVCVCKLLLIAQFCGEMLNLNKPLCVCGYHRYMMMCVHLMPVLNGTFCGPSVPGIDQ